RTSRSGAPACRRPSRRRPRARRILCRLCSSPSFVEFLVLTFPSYLPSILAQPLQGSAKLVVVLVPDGVPQPVPLFGAPLFLVEEVLNLRVGDYDLLGLHHVEELVRRVPLRVRYADLLDYGHRLVA